jgi:hypothetical protein
MTAGTNDAGSLAGYAPFELGWGGGEVAWYGPGFRESADWHLLRRQGQDPPRAVLPGRLFFRLRGGRPCSSGKNVLIYPDRTSALAALAARACFHQRNGGRQP